MSACNCYAYDQRVVLDLHPIDNRIRECSSCGRFWITRVWRTGPPPGFRGQWSGVTEDKIGKRRALRLVRKGQASLLTSYAAAGCSVSGDETR